MARYDKHVSEGLVHGTTALSSLGGGTTINNATENELVTVASDTDELDAEANLTFNGTTLALTGNETISPANDVGAAALTITNIDTNQIALDINASNIDANIIDIADTSLTSAAALYIDSNSSSTAARSIATIIQNHASATKANTLTLQQDNTTVDAADMAASLNLTGNPKIKVGTDAKNLTFHQYDGYEVARVHDNSGIGGFGYKKLIVDVEEALNLSSVGNAIPYSGATISLVQSDAGAYAITLPTAANTTEGKQITGWHISVILTGADAENVTIVRGDTGNDSILGMVVAGDAAPSGITVTSNVITFVGGTAVVGDRADITCTGADASNTYFVVQGMCKV